MAASDPPVVPLRLCGFLCVAERFRHVPHIGVAQGGLADCHAGPMAHRPTQPVASMKPAKAEVPPVMEIATAAGTASHKGERALARQLVNTALSPCAPRHESIGARSDPATAVLV